jgi:hypothetical protein
VSAAREITPIRMIFSGIRLRGCLVTDDRELERNVLVAFPKGMFVSFLLKQHDVEGYG